MIGRGGPVRLPRTGDLGMGWPRLRIVETYCWKVGGGPGLETVVAREVAPAVLGHNIGDASTLNEEIEAETRALVRSWGTRDVGADEPD